MPIKIMKEKNTIGFLLSGQLTGNEFIHVIHDIELIFKEKNPVSVLFEPQNFFTHNFNFNIKDFDLYKKHRGLLKKIAVVTEGMNVSFIKDHFKAFTNSRIKRFDETQIEKALKWIEQ